jgi:plastocyanin
VHAQSRPATSSSAELRLRIVSSLPGKHRAVPAVLWLEPLAGTPALSFPPHAHYTLLQKNRTFIPHLQAIPAGSVVEFPNEDPFFHNVFSLYEGKRFDLGLYEAGSSKAVTFSRVGVSYIFCNIHPEMSAVVIALGTPLYAEADAKDSVSLRGIPPGDYKLHVWIEGVPQSFLDGLSRPVHFSGHAVDLGVLKAPIAGARTTPHTNMYGQEYAPESQSPYSPH